MTTKNEAYFLEKLQSTKIIFDPTFDHHYGTQLPPKVALIPKDLYQDLMIYLGSKAG